MHCRTPSGFAGWPAVVVLAGCLGAAAAQDAKPMAAGAHPAFEVAAIRLTPAGDQNQGFHNHGSRMEIENETVKSMLMFAYGLQHKQIVGEPAWVNETAYDVEGILDSEGVPSIKQWQEAVQKLLVERFHLTMHREKRDLSYFALRLNGTPKLVKAANPSAPPDQTGNGEGSGMSMKFTSNSMDEFDRDELLHGPAGGKRDGIAGSVGFYAALDAGPDAAG